MKILQSENEVRQLYFLTTSTTQTKHNIPFNPRILNRLYALLNANFWLPCHKCDQYFGGHEFYGSEGHVGVCPTCVLKHFNNTGKFSND